MYDPDSGFALFVYDHSNQVSYGVASGLCLNLQSETEKAFEFVMSNMEEVQYLEILYQAYEAERWDVEKFIM